MFYELESSDAFWGVVAIIYLVGIIPAVLFLLNLRGLLEQVKPQNRTLQPNLVWLNLIPIFNYVWLIITVIKVRDSVDAEVRSRGWVPKSDMGFGVGLAFAILWLLSGLWLWIPFLVCWIIYWTKTAEVKGYLARAQPPASWTSATTPATQGAAVLPGPSVGPAAAPGQANGQACASCGRAAERGDLFCRSCGGSMQAQAPAVAPAGSANCPHCGVVYRQGAAYCWSCGQPAVR